MSRPRLLDLFCGAGGCSVGYARAGFEVVGVDLNTARLKHYPFESHHADALAFVTDHWREFDAIHASPPCQAYSITKHTHSNDHPDLLEPTREALAATGLHYVIENVPGAPMVTPITLCGSSFGLKVRRHRQFESSLPLMSLPCDHKAQGRPVGVYGSMRDDIPQGGKTAGSIEEAREAMGIDWMRWRSTNQERNDIKEAIPPAYTEFIGAQLIDHLKGAAA